MINFFNFFIQEKLISKQPPNNLSEESANLPNNLRVNTSWYIVGNLFSRFMNFLLLPVYSHYISTNDFGIYSLLMAFYAVMSVIYQSGFQSALTKFYIEANDKIDKKKVFSSIFNFILIVSLISSLLLLVFDTSVSNLLLGTDKYAFEYWSVVGILFFDTIGYFIIHLHRTKELAKRITFLLILSGSLNFILNLFFVVYHELGIKGVLYSQLVSSVIVLIILSFYLKGEYIFRIEKAIIKKSLLFALPLIIGGLASSLVEVADRFFINLFRDSDNVGVYSFAYRISMVINLINISFRTSWMPYSLRRIKNGDNYKMIFGEIFKKYYIFLLYLTLAVYIVITNIFNIEFNGIALFNADYKDGLSVLMFLLFGYLSACIGSFFSYYPYIANRSYIFLVSDSIGLVINILLNLVLIPTYGIVGAGIATFLSLVATNFYLFLVANKSMPINLDYHLLTVLSLTFLMVIVCSYLVFEFSIPYVFYAIISIVGLIMYTVFTFFVWRIYCRGITSSGQ